MVVKLSLRIIKYLYIISYTLNSAPEEDELYFFNFLILEAHSTFI